MSDELYLCDPRINCTCNGTVCFYGDGPHPYCFTTNDPACAVTGPEGGPLRADIKIGPDGQVWNLTLNIKKRRETDAKAEDAAGTAGDI